MVTHSTAPEYALTASTSGSMVSRAIILFVNFFLIILAYYHIKPASRSLFIEYIGVDYLPYVWIGTAVVLGSFISYYHRLVERYRRLLVVLGTCLTFGALLVLFRLWLAGASAFAAIAFYVFVDIFSVVLVEQFWSLTNTIYSTEEGKRWYGIVGTGGLVGGVVGGIAARFMLQTVGLRTPDLLLVATAILVLVFVVNLAMGHMGIYEELSATTAEQPVVAAGGWNILLQSRYLMLIAATLLLTQMAAPLVEFQFIKTVELTFTELDQRTSFFSTFFSILGLIAIATNIIFTPLVHRFLGVIAGLIAQPLSLCLFSFGFMLHPILLVGAMMKITDRGLSYSINRASKELLYVPIDPVQTYQAKAWIDMFGYRLFKVAGSVVILALTQWLPFGHHLTTLSWFTVFCCLIWMLVVRYLAREYRLQMEPSTAT